MPDTGAQAMQNLQNGWYNSLVSGLGLSGNTFQLMTPSQPVGLTSDSIWQIFNTIPPQSLTQQASAGGNINRFFDDYSAIVNTVNPPVNQKLAQILGDSYQSWLTYWRNDTSSDTQEQAFDKWSSKNVDPSQQAAAKTAFLQAQNNVISVAVKAVNDPSAKNANGTPIFTKDISALNQGIVSSASASVNFDSHTADSNVQNTWAKGSVGFVYDFFSLGGGGSYSSLSAKAASSRVTVSATFDHVMTFTAGPGNWFNSAALNYAYKDSSYTVWPAGTNPTWASTFGPNGNMQRFCTSLVVADGINMTMTSSATYSSTDQQTIIAEAKGGFWPFFSASAQGGHSSKVTFNSDGEMTVTFQNPKGAPFVLGLNVQQINALLGS